jgi:hypothetical protein
MIIPQSIKCLQNIPLLRLISVLFTTASGRGTVPNLCLRNKKREKLAVWGNASKVFYGSTIGVWSPAVREQTDWMTLAGSAYDFRFIFAWNRRPHSAFAQTNLCSIHDKLLAGLRSAFKFKRKMKRKIHLESNFSSREKNYFFTKTNFIRTI